MNTALIALGALLASFIGTTGASMVLIRPLLRANASRVRRAHIVVFFIFIVSNCGGLLTPLGDPPLFLGFLKGVPFEWTLQLWPQWALVNGLLLVIFNGWDQVVFNSEELERPGSQLEQVMQHEPLRIEGWHNLLFLAWHCGHHLRRRPRAGQQRADLALRHARGADGCDLAGVILSHVHGDSGGEPLQLLRRSSKSPCCLPASSSP